MHTHAVAVTHTWSGFSGTNLPGNALYKRVHWPTHVDIHMHTHTHASWLWLSVVSCSADTWKDTLERGPFHSNSAQQHLAWTQWLSRTVVKGMRVLNSTAAHSSLPAKWGWRRVFHGHSTPPAAHSRALQSTHSPVVHCGVRDLQFEWTSKWELAMRVKYRWLHSDGSHSERRKISCRNRESTCKMLSAHVQVGDKWTEKPALSVLVSCWAPWHKSTV